jgi:hypothetical protein
VDPRREIERVASLLHERHPRFPESAVRGLVERTFARFSDAPVQSFVPILAYRHAHAELHYADTGIRTDEALLEAVRPRLVLEETT